ncbi:DNA translocase FtsK 4TM domain-containing protein [Blattabacterium cuenoti]|uniref:DNA translocase FtsK 4TM domain-containing protein n=1 Tax=Blattabacterium cuenoti TaxID=1653831 RepID=UPI00163B7531|nr:DNA translocase FtsK 4TM domain-containing protein [Blattabacterium cuenoti]
MHNHFSKKNHQTNKKHFISYIIGLLFLGNSIFLFLSFLSFFFHWKEDQSQLDKIFNQEIIVENLLGKVGAFLAHFFIHCGIGISSFFFPILCFFKSIIILFETKRIFIKQYHLIKLNIFFLSICIPITCSLIIPKYGLLSGILGFEISTILISFFGKVGLGILLSIVFILYIILVFRLHSPRNTIRLIAEITPQKKIYYEKYNKFLENLKKNPKKKIIISNYNIKHHPIIFSQSAKYDDSFIKNKKSTEKNKEKLITIFKYYKIEIENIKITIGPTITLYELFPKVGVRVSTIKSLENEIALSVSAIGIRILGPLPGRGSIGIEIPNNIRTIVYMTNIMYSKEMFEKSKNKELPIPLGKTVFNEIFMIDLAKMPHLLIAGSTGQGKSVGINIMIIFLLYHKSPKYIKFVFIDPKKVELSIYNKISKSYFAFIPNYTTTRTPIITDITIATKALNSLCKEMDNRYFLMEKYNVRNIQEYNQNKKLPLPYIILIIDEFADLSLSFKRKEIEIYITRLTQLARAVGIHLIIATQRPSVDVITGLIKSNFTARIAFRVSSKIDSRTILDCNGAEKLVGQGDLLFSNKQELVRIQCPFVNISEIQQIVDFYDETTSIQENFFLPNPDI